MVNVISTPHAKEIYFQHSGATFFQGTSNELYLVRIPSFHCALVFQAYCLQARLKYGNLSGCGGGIMKETNHIKICLMVLSSPHLDSNALFKYKAIACAPSFHGAHETWTSAPKVALTILLRDTVSLCQECTSPAFSHDFFDQTCIDFLCYLIKILFK